MSVNAINLTINTDAPFQQDFYINTFNLAENLTGYGVSSYIRKHPENLKVVAKFNTNILNPEEGIIRVSLASSITSQIKPGRYVYDVLLTSPTGRKVIVVEGNILARDNLP